MERKQGNPLTPCHEAAGGVHDVRRVLLLARCGRQVQQPRGLCWVRRHGRQSRQCRLAVGAQVVEMKAKFESSSL